MIPYYRVSVFITVYDLWKMEIQKKRTMKKVSKRSKQITQRQQQYQQQQTDQKSKCNVS